MTFDYVPYNLLIDDIIPMGEDITKPHNTPGIGNLLKDIGIGVFYTV